MKGYIEQAYKGYTDWWRYLLGTFFIFFIWQLGSSIHVFVVLSKLAKDGLSFEEALLKVSDVDVLMKTLELNLNFFLLLLGFAVGFAGLYFVVKFFHQLKFTNFVTSRPKIDWRRIGFSFLLWSIISFAFFLITLYMSPDEYEFNFEFKRFFILAIIGIIFVPIQTTFEELYFRGYLLQGFGTLFKSRAAALLLSSFLFGILHIFNPEISKLGYGLLVSYIGTGLLLGIMTLMDEGMELAIGFHAANNLIIALLVTSEWTAFDTHSIYKFTGEPSLIVDAYIPVFVVYPIILIIYSKIYKWNNWRQRLFGKVKLYER